MSEAFDLKNGERGTASNATETQCGNLKIIQQRFVAGCGASAVNQNANED